MSSRDVAEPAYRQLSKQLRAQIASGSYRGGQRLPTESELATSYGLSRQTVRRAFLELVTEGVVYRVPGRGTFATEPDTRYLRQLGSIEDLMNLASDTTMEIVTPLRRLADIEAASRLRLDTDLVCAVTFRRLHDGIPFVLTTVSLPESIARHVMDTPELASGAVGSSTIIGLLEPHLTVPIVQAAQSITVAPATGSVASALNCGEGHPMLRVDRLYGDADGDPVELAVSYFMPELYTYRVVLHRAGPANEPDAALSAVRPPAGRPTQVRINPT